MNRKNTTGERVCVCVYFFNEIKTNDETESGENKTKIKRIRSKSNLEVCRFCCFQQETICKKTLNLCRKLTCKNGFQDISSSFEWHLIGNRIVCLLLFQSNPSNLFLSQNGTFLMERTYQRQNYLSPQKNTHSNH